MLFQPLVNVLAKTLRPYWLKDTKLGTYGVDIFSIAMSFVRDTKVEGDFLEFGVSIGTSFVRAFHAASKEKLNSMTFYAFDSFEGLPEVTGIDAGKCCRYEKGQYACSLNSFRNNISKQGVDLNRVECVCGYYETTLNASTKKKLHISKASVVHIDCDLYDSTVLALDFITEYICDGTVIIFDDWFSYKGRQDLGEAKAFNDWLGKNATLKATEYFNYSRTGKSFLMSKN